MTNIMLDLETLSVDSNATIISISAVVFDLHTGKTGGEFEVGLGILEQLLSGSVIDNSTIDWWKNQNKEAKESLVNISTSSIAEALESFNIWIAKAVTCEVKDVKLWGNGVSADNTWLRNLYRRTDTKFILPYWCDNDVRTLVNLGNINTKDFQFTGIKHNGIDDCKHQINYCSVAYKGLK